MNLREEIIKNLDTLSEDALEGVLEYIQFIQEPEEVEPTEGELKAIAQGKRLTPEANTSAGGILRVN